MEFLSRLGQAVQSQPFQNALAQYQQSQALPVVNDLQWAIMSQDPNNFTSNYLSQLNTQVNQQAENRRLQILEREEQRKIQAQQALRQMAQRFGTGQSGDSALANLAQYAAMSGDPDALIEFEKQRALSQLPTAGGATGVLVDRLRQDNPNLSYEQALMLAQSGLRKGVTIDEQTGMIQPIQGFGEATGQIEQTQNYMGETGTLTAQRELQPTIEAEKLRATNAVEKRSAYPKAKAAFRAAQFKQNNAVNTINEILPNVNLATAGFASLSSAVAGTPAANLAAKINQLEAFLGFSELQDMRASSPTGGALGAVTERELELLSSTLQSVKQSQSPEQLQQGLAQLRQLLLESGQLRQIALDEDFASINESASKEALQAAPFLNQQPKVRRFNPATGKFE